MKSFNRLLKNLSARVLKKYRPFIIAVTGSVGKTSTKEAIFSVVKKFDPSVKKNFGNYNNEIGVPLTILAGNEKITGILGYLKILFRGIILLVFRCQYPKTLILELAADKPGDIKYLTEFIKPNISVITAIGEIPVHVEFFSGPKSVAKEKSGLVEATVPNGRVILNYDDEVVLEMKQKSKAQVLTFGFSPEAEIKAINYEIHTPSLEAWDNTSEQSGISFKLEYGGSFVPVRLSNVFGKQAVYAAMAAASCGLSLGMNLVDISEALKSYKSSAGRMKMLKGIKNTWIIDDTYNAAPLSMSAALETLKNLKNGFRKIAVLGDMKEIGKYSEEAHKTIGEDAAGFVDLLLTVGEKARFIKTGAFEDGLSEDKIFHFETSDEAGRFLQDKIQQGDLILIKGSQSMRMEKITEEIMAEPEKAKDLLVRQDAKWKIK